LKWHKIGVRGVRLNLSSNGRTIETDELESLLQRYADAIRSLNWVLQVYIPMALIASLEAIIPRLNVRFCIDHLGHPGLGSYRGTDPYQLPGFPSLARLLNGGHVFVKLSAPYRLSHLEDQKDLEPVAKEVLRLGGQFRVVFATDWPHTRFEGLDIRPWMERVLDWCNDDQALIERIFRGNAEDLWSVARREL
jgi:predicted TIM-barrel fold metal-dependent hydrolase